MQIIENLVFDDVESVDVFDFKCIFWLIFGLVLFLPIDIFTDGLHLAYFQILLLFFLTRRLDTKRLILFFIYFGVVFFSVTISASPELSSVVNPAFCAIALLVVFSDHRSMECIKIGFYVSALLNSFSLIYLAIYKGFGNIFELLASRVWALDEIPYFGNGLAMLFSATMLFAYREKRFILFLVFFVGGLLTTSRIPLFMFIALLCMLFFEMFRHNLKYIALTIVSFVLIAAVFFLTDIFDVSERQIEFLAGRLGETEDRFDVYTAAFSELYQHPFFGVGSMKLDYYEHAHNSYLQVAFKFGLFALISWLCLLFSAFFNRLAMRKDFAFLFLFLIISFSQIGLLNPNLLIVLLLYVQLFNVPAIKS